MSIQTDSVRANPESCIVASAPAWSGGRFSRELLSKIRGWEIERIAALLPPESRILEIGAGTGEQARRLTELGFEVEAVEITTSLYADSRVFPVVDYNGRVLPFGDDSFDAVFSSNVLEHVPDLPCIHSEIRRVLRHGGVVVHVLPTHVWRVWTSVSTVLTNVVSGYSGGGVMDAIRGLFSSFRQARHGERGNFITEAWYFHPSWWRGNFRNHGFLVERDEPMGIFYTGNLFFGEKLDLERRARLARLLGSAVHVFVLREALTLKDALG